MRCPPLTRLSVAHRSVPPPSSISTFSPLCARRRHPASVLFATLAPHPATTVGVVFTLVVDGVAHGPYPTPPSTIVIVFLGTSPPPSEDVEFDSPALGILQDGGLHRPRLVHAHNRRRHLPVLFVGYRFITLKDDGGQLGRLRDHLALGSLPLVACTLAKGVKSGR